MAATGAEARPAIRTALSLGKQAEAQVQRNLDLFSTHVEGGSRRVVLITLKDPADGRNWTIIPYHRGEGELAEVHMFATDRRHPEQFMLELPDRTGTASDHLTSYHTENDISTGTDPKNPKAQLEVAKLAEVRLRSILGLPPEEPSTGTPVV